MVQQQPPLPDGSIVVDQKTHELKTWPDSFSAMATGRKKFDFRRDDRGFKVGDVLVLREWDPDHPMNQERGHYTGRWLEVIVTYILRASTHGVPAGFCVMSLSPPRWLDHARD